MFCFCFFILMSHGIHFFASIQENIFRKLGAAIVCGFVTYNIGSTRPSHVYARGVSYKDNMSHKNVMNWTKEELAALLQKHGYLVKEEHEGWPLGMIGDVAYYPEELLPETGMPHGRRNLLSTKSIWVDSGKDSIIPYYYDTESKADQTVFEQAVKTWSDNTCIKFAKQPPNNCRADLGYAAVCVGNFGGCFSHLGRKYGLGMRHSQKMSVQPDGCEMVAAAHEFGHALGLCHEMARADREKHIHVLYTNIDLDTNKLNDKEIRNKWFQGARCNADQMYDAPKPYDPMSLMQYGTSDFAGEDQRPVYLHKNPHYQYMFDYHRLAGYAQTHYDNMVTNMGYQCVQKWKESCEASGQSVPNCKNYGYVGKACKCICPKGFSGSTCGTKDGPMFPLMDRAKAMLDITDPGLVDMKGKGMHDENHNYPNDGFTTSQYIAVIIRSGSKTRISVDVAQDFEAVKQSFSQSQSTWIKQGSYECDYGLKVYVGHAEIGNMRVECISSMVNNEPKEYRTVLRSHTNKLDIVGMGGWAVCYYGGPPITRKAMEFQFTVAFLDRPEDILSQEAKNPGKLVEAVKGIVKEVEGNKAKVIIGVVVLLLGAGAGGGSYWWYKKKKIAVEGSDLEQKPVSPVKENRATPEDKSPEDASSDSSD